MALQIPKGGGFSYIIYFSYEKVRKVRKREGGLFNSGVVECARSGRLNSKGH